MPSDDCIFCKMVAGDVPVAKVYEDESVLAFLDIGPLSDGHTLVIPKEHFETIDSCPAELVSEIGLRLGRIAKAVKEAM